MTKAQKIIKVFEDLLDSKNIYIKCDDETEESERDSDGNTAIIYGTEYANLEDDINYILKDKRKKKRKTSVEINYYYLWIALKTYIRKYGDYNTLSDMICMEKEELVRNDHNPNYHKIWARLVDNLDTNKDTYAKDKVKHDMYKKIMNHMIDIEMTALTSYALSQIEI